MSPRVCGRRACLRMPRSSMQGAGPAATPTHWLKPGSASWGWTAEASLVEQVRARSTGARFVCADLLAWDPGERVAAVLCRGVLNELMADADRRAAFTSFASWIRPGGVLLADVRDWRATAARYAARHSHDSVARRAGREVRFSSTTRLEHSRRLMCIRERYAGTVDGVAVDETYDFSMRCWTAEELTACAPTAGFATVEVRRGADEDIAANRLLLVARR
jgi:glycine/sarcosine N-methyltransferase